MIFFVSRLVQRGVTLVELVISIVIISVGLAGIIVVINRNVLSSADPMIWNQTVAIGEAYLDEILLKNFCDPSSTCTPGNLPGGPLSNCEVCPANEGARNLYDNVCDYNGTNETPPKDQTGSDITSLAGYGVQVTVTANGAVLNALTGASCQVLRVDVTVSGPNNTTYSIGGYRTNYQ